MQMILSKIALGIVLIVIVLFMIENTLVGAISLFSLIYISYYIGKLEDKTTIDKKVRRIAWAVYAVTTIVGLLSIL